MIVIPEALRTLCQEQGLSLPEELTEEQAAQALPYLIEAVQQGFQLQEAIKEEIRRAMP